jgi:hypothetical protein
MSEFNEWLKVMKEDFEKLNFKSLTFHQYCDLWIKRELGLKGSD